MSKKKKKKILASQDFFSSTQDLVNSKEQLLRFKLFDKDTCFVILFSLIAIISKKNCAIQEMLKAIKIFIKRKCVYIELG